MYDARFRREVLALVRSRGLSLNEISRRTGVSRATLREWDSRDGAFAPSVSEAGWCSRCDRQRDLDRPTYALLLGLYLGDGCLSAMPKGVFMLRIACCGAYPALVEECVDAVEAIGPRKAYRVKGPGVVQVTAYWKHWPCLFPQHGPGRKHDRPIVLEPWQLEIADAHPGELLRGLLHSDGCRVTNWTEKVVAGERRRYEYGRWFFSNESEDIRRICEDALDRLGVPHRRNRHNSVSVARREGVALLDQVVGPKR